MVVIVYQHHVEGGSSTGYCALGQQSQTDVPAALRRSFEKSQQVVFMPSKATITIVGLATALALVLLRMWSQSESDAVAAAATHGNSKAASISGGSSQSAIVGGVEQRGLGKQITSTGFAPAERSSASQANSVISEDAYASYDAQIKEGLAPPAWFYAERNVYDEVTATDPTASVTNVVCGEVVCRVEVQHGNAEAREKFAAQGFGGLVPPRLDARIPGDDFPSTEVVSTSAPVLVSTGQPISSATMYRYPEDDPTRTVVYVIKVASPEEMMQKLQNQLAMRAH